MRISVYRITLYLRKSFTEVYSHRCSWIREENVQNCWIQVTTFVESHPFIFWVFAFADSADIIACWAAGHTNRLICWGTQLASCLIAGLFALGRHKIWALATSLIWIIRIPVWASRKASTLKKIIQRMWASETILRIPSTTGLARAMAKFAFFI